MEKYSITALRKHLYKVVDQVLESGVPVQIERNGRTVVIAPSEPVGSRLHRLTRRNGIIGDPEDLVNLNVGEWNEQENPRSST